MRKHDSDQMEASQQSSIPCQNRFLASSAELSSDSESLNRPESSQLQIFVRIMSAGKTIAIHADKNDTVEKLHHMIEFKTKIPVIEQRFLYKGKQLQCEKRLSCYSIEQDESLHLVGPMRSKEHPAACQIVDDIVSFVSGMSQGGIMNESIAYKKLTAFFAMIPEGNDDSISKYFEIFSSSSVPADLVMLYLSSLEINKSFAKSSIELFLTSCIALPKIQQNFCLPIVLEFCGLLRKACSNNMLYMYCRRTLGRMLESSDTSGGFHLVEEILPYFTELSDLMLQELIKDSGPSSSDALEFTSFWHPLRKAVEFQTAGSIPIVFALINTLLEPEIENLYLLFKRLLNTVDTCMGRIESLLGNERIGNTEAMSELWSEHLTVMKIVSSMGKLYQGGKEEVVDVLKLHKVAFCDLDELELHIDRSNLLSDSYKYIVGATREAFHGVLSITFKEEKATGVGVVRAWLYAVCKEIFHSQNTVFLRSADDVRRLSPDSASKMDPMHPDFYKFTGRVIALALKHKVQLGVLFDRIFFLQLSEQPINLEDIKETDKTIYNSWRHILEMDPELLDANDFGLTFELDTEELGKMVTVELCKDGRSMTVDSKNRKRYIDLLIKHRFATRASSHVARFCQGFSDILSHSVPSSSFFKIIKLEDLDGMLGGEDNKITIEDWKEHTEFIGFGETDPQITWFWKILTEMTETEQRNLLFFWISTKYVPVEGFRGLESQLFIYRLYESDDSLPLAHTCYNQLSIPKYSTLSIMEERIRFIAQEHVCSSFGNE